MELLFGASILSRGGLDSASEQALIERCRRNDFEAFGKIVDAYQGRVFGFVRRMVPDADEATDIAQEVFIRAFQGFQRFDARSSLRTWLFRIAHNLCIDRARKLKRAPAEATLDAIGDEDLVFDVPDSRWDPETMMLGEELRSVIEGSIATMSEKLRSVLLLHDREDFAYDEIAQTLNVPVGTVKSRLFLARAHLQASLNEYLGTEAPRK